MIIVTLVLRSGGNTAVYKRAMGRHWQAWGASSEVEIVPNNTTTTSNSWSDKQLLFCFFTVPLLLLLVLVLVLLHWYHIILMASITDEECLRLEQC